MNAFRGALASFVPWTAAEDAIFRQAYNAGGIHGAIAALPKRNVNSLYHRAQRLGLSRRRRWSPIDDVRLRKLWNAELDLDQIAERLGRTQISTYWRAQKIGLPLGCPDGWEYLSHAAKRTGYDTGQLRTILAADGISLRCAIAAPNRKRRGKVTGFVRRTHIVPPGAVDAAVEAWLEREPLEAAARRVQMCAETLARRLRSIGVTKDVGRKRYWRVSAEDVSRALEATA